MVALVGFDEHVEGVVDLDVGVAEPSERHDLATNRTPMLMRNGVVGVVVANAITPVSA